MECFPFVWLTCTKIWCSLCPVTFCKPCSCTWRPLKPFVETGPVIRISLLSQAPVAEDRGLKGGNVVVWGWRWERATTFDLFRKGFFPPTSYNKKRKLRQPGSEIESSQTTSRLRRWMGFNLEGLGGCWEPLRVALKPGLWGLLIER